MAQDWPNDVLQLILGSFPFPSIFKIECLSEYWRSKFLDNYMKIDIMMVSPTTWPHYSPVFVNRDVILGYDTTQHQWKSVCPLSFLPQDMFVSRLTSRAGQEFVGPLMLVSNCQLYPEVADPGVPSRLLIANVFTRKFREFSLPSIPEDVKVMDGFNCSSEVFLLLPGIHQDHQVFRVVILSTFISPDLEDIWLVQALYDSTLNQWTSKVVCDNLPSGACDLCCSRVYATGFLYVMTNTINEDWHVLVFNVDGEQEFKYHELDVSAGAYAGQLVMWGDRIFVASVERKFCQAKNCALLDRLTLLNTLWVQELDLETFKLTMVSQGPPTITPELQNHEDAMHLLASWKDLSYPCGSDDHDEKVHIVADGNFIYYILAYFDEIPHLPIISYNFSTSAWLSLPPPSHDFTLEDCVVGCGFAPGISPFAAV